MAEFLQHPMALPRCTWKKLEEYDKVIKGLDHNYWDVVVVTARDDSQRKIYDHQIRQKIMKEEIPSAVEYVVISDPPGPKIGNGGSTLYCLEYLCSTFGPENLEKWKVMIIHAGGYSQRLPNQSILGKVFLTLPCGGRHMQMFDALLMMYIDIPKRMNPGVFVASSDVIFLFNGAGDWDFRGPGFTAIAHPMSVTLAGNHGVFILDGIHSPWEKYKIDPQHPAMVSLAKHFIHKKPANVLIESGALIPGTNLVYVDLAYYFDGDVIKRLLKFYAEVQPLTSEVDAYADILGALGAESSINSSETSTVQRKLHEVLRESTFRVAIFHEAQFNHLGTISECLHHFCENKTLQDAYGFRVQSSKNDDVSKCKEYTVTYSVLKDRVTIGRKCVVEYCIIENSVTVGESCLLSYLHIPENSSIPNSTFMHTMAIERNDKIFYTTCVFASTDDLKQTLPHDDALKINILDTPLASVMDRAKTSTDSLWSQKTPCSLWSAKLFQLCESRRESCQSALKFLQAIKMKDLDSYLEAISKAVSMEDVMMSKSSTAMMEIQSELQLLRL